jgi:hypothetical protein
MVYYRKNIPAGVGLLHNLHNLIVKAMNMSFDGNILCDS